MRCEPTSLCPGWHTALPLQLKHRACVRGWSTQARALTSLVVGMQSLGKSIDVSPLPHTSGWRAPSCSWLPAAEAKLCCGSWLGTPISNCTASFGLNMSIYDAVYWYCLHTCPILIAAVVSGGPEAVAKTVVVLALTDEQAEEATHELWTHKFFGLERSNVILLVQVGGHCATCCQVCVAACTWDCSGLHIQPTQDKMLHCQEGRLAVATSKQLCRCRYKLDCTVGSLQDRRAPYKYDATAKAWLQVRPGNTVAVPSSAWVVDC